MRRLYALKVIFGGALELKKFEGDLKAYSDRLWRVKSVLGSILDRNFGAGDCDWQMLPNFVIVLDKYYLMLKEEKIPNALIPGVKHLTQNKDCGTREEFLRKHKK